MNLLQWAYVILLNSNYICIISWITFVLLKSSNNMINYVHTFLSRIRQQKFCKFTQKKAFLKQNKFTSIDNPESGKPNPDIYPIDLQLNKETFLT